MVTPSDQVVLRNSGAGGWAAIREVHGVDEEAITSTGAPAAIALIDRLLLAVPGTSVGPGRAASLTAADRDLVLAAVYRQVYGPRVVSVLTCRSCGERFDADFDLASLLTSIGVAAGPAHALVSQVSTDGVFEAEGGLRFRLPTGEEECELVGMAPAEGARWLLERCVISGDIESTADAVQLAMERVAPVAEADISARCPECGEPQTVHFDLQRYLLTGLMSERKMLVTEVHLLARAYGWSRSEIMDMPRSQRKSAVALVTGAEPARWRY